MLVLSRQINESIMIGDSIEVTIVDVKGDKVRIGITAPRDVPVHRKEVYLAILEENLAASKHSDFNALADIGNMFPQQPPSKAKASGRQPKQDKPHKG